MELLKVFTEEKVNEIIDVNAMEPQNIREHLNNLFDELYPNLPSWLIHGNGLFDTMENNDPIMADEEMHAFADGFRCDGYIVNIKEEKYWDDLDVERWVDLVVSDLESDSDFDIDPDEVESLIRARYED